MCRPPIWNKITKDHLSTPNLIPAIFRLNGLLPVFYSGTLKRIHGIKPNSFQSHIQLNILAFRKRQGNKLYFFIYLVYPCSFLIWRNKNNHGIHFKRKHTNNFFKHTYKHCSYLNHLNIHMQTTQMWQRIGTGGF